MSDRAEVDHALEISPNDVHRDWDRRREPVLSVESGEAVRFTCHDAFVGEITKETKADVLGREMTTGHPLTGPVALKGALPGDVLAVHLKRIEHDGWGYTFFRPGSWGLGLLPEEFEEPSLHVWDLVEDRGQFVDGIKVPLDPFPGVVGVAPDTNDTRSTVPPRRVGGNLDIKHLTEGSTVYLPIEVAGGLFSIGDGHAAQGDGEVCVSAIEAPLSITAELTLHTDMDIEQPRFETAGRSPTDADIPVYGTTGIADDLMEATKTAVREMIKYLTTERGLTREEAYILCSVVVDLKINEVVNDPNYVVSAHVPTTIFPN
ncbi:acetamidase/formamidase family protein [Halococcus sp. IIIV-5B]|uniref:acetamidase/formamidase family protein n=1 Tax=Halococcus sp. IIIV-5B TaxID=2321230 RepID=UPI000E72AFE0|nr:acetamidase/formamidase family protein [Halococcus sp. IIIV-5B]RJT07467.1 acetamidase [Halococcus sp. IIIV-5B]